MRLRPSSWIKTLFASSFICCVFARGVRGVEDIVAGGDFHYRFVFVANGDDSQPVCALAAPANVGPKLVQATQQLQQLLALTAGRKVHRCSDETETPISLKVLVDHNPRSSSALVGELLTVATEGSAEATPARPCGGVIAVYVAAAAAPPRLRVEVEKAVEPALPRAERTRLASAFDREVREEPAGATAQTVLGEILPRFLLEELIGQLEDDENAPSAAAPGAAAPGAAGAGAPNAAAPGAAAPGAAGAAAGGAAGSAAGGAAGGTAGGVGPAAGGQQAAAGGVYGTPNGAAARGRGGAAGGAGGPGGEFNFHGRRASHHNIDALVSRLVHQCLVWAGVLLALWTTVAEAMRITLRRRLLKYGPFFTDPVPWPGEGPPASAGASVDALALGFSHIRSREPRGSSRRTRSPGW